MSTPETMPAGRELDALVAEKVMGWRVIETDDCNGEDNFWLSKDGQNVYRGKYDRPLDLPGYSTSIAAAWDVVETMRERGFDADIMMFTGGDVQVHFRGGDVSHEGHERIAPLAICRAALKAVEA